MLANWSRETTTTTGPGDLTITSVTGYPSFSVAVGVGVANRFYYAILDDTTGLPIENGLGYLSSPTVMVRDVVFETMVAGTFAEVSPSKVTLAAGTKRVICTGLAHALRQSLPLVGNVVGGGVRYTGNACASGLGASYNQLDVNGRLNVSPFYLDHTGVYDAIGVQVIGAIASTSIRLALYAVDSNGAPGALVVEGSTSIDCSSTGLKLATFTARKLKAGWYFVAAKVEGGTPTLRGAGTALSSILFQTPLGSDGETAGWSGYALSVAAGPMPATCPGCSWTANLGVPNVILRNLL